MPAFTPATAAEAAAKSHGPDSQRNHGPRLEQNALKQAVELRDLCYRAAQAMSPAVSPSEKNSARDALALASLVKAWDAMANRIRILGGAPLPGSCRPAPEPTKAKRWKPTARLLPPPSLADSAPAAQSPV